MAPPAKKQKTLHVPVSTTRTCAECNQVKETQSFSKNQRKKGANAKCTDCCTQQKECSDCKKPKSRGAYGEDQWKLEEGAICKKCVQYPKKECSDCKCKKSSSQYKLQEDAVCKECHHATLEKKRVEERERTERLAKEPRLCVLCNQKKTKEAFSTHQWDPYIETEMSFGRIERRKCLKCFPKEQEDEIRRLEQLECERQEKEEFEMESISGVLELKNESGCVCYNLPAEWELPFRDSPPCDICGDHNVIFQCSFFYEGAEERTTRGKLVLKEQDGLLHGRVDIDEDIPVGAAFHFNADFDFDEMPTKNAQHSERIWGTEFVVTGLDANVELEFRPQGDEVITATLKVLDKRFGLPWLMDENYSNLDECVPFKFDTLEEAEFIAKKANDHSDSWLCNHLGMDAYVAKHIHEFVAWRPDPVLFLEPGDLILHVKWCKDFREGAGSLLVARKASDCARKYVGE
mmetsp:Transcript_28528/g.51674  ORF Transcript_28528/g.51674 Transcript_28528/m.51674 type:complete len:461 (+) Transcript_28528:123-1505(+)